MIAHPILAHGSWATLAFVLLLEGLPWILATVSLWRGLAKKKPRWIGIICGGLASSIAATFMWLASPMDWNSIWAFIVAVPIALGAIGFWLSLTFNAPPA